MKHAQCEVERGGTHNTGDASCVKNHPGSPSDEGRLAPEEVAQNDLVRFFQGFLGWEEGSLYDEAVVLPRLQEEVLQICRLRRHWVICPTFASEAHCGKRSEIVPDYHRHTYHRRGNKHPLRGVDEEQIKYTNVDCDDDDQSPAVQERPPFSFAFLLLFLPDPGASLRRFLRRSSPSKQNLRIPLGQLSMTHRS